VNADIHTVRRGAGRRKSVLAFRVHIDRAFQADLVTGSISLPVRGHHVEIPERSHRLLQRSESLGEDPVIVRKEDQWSSIGHILILKKKKPSSLRIRRESAREAVLVRDGIRS
jgi:hypothetical protein